MQVGDLVRHKMHDYYGIVIEIRLRQQTAMKMVKVSWPDYVGANMLHPDSQLQVVT
jgi:heat shock protein HspQ|tara:strand:- start:164 stop:331 length:168 start_codon:yes stop_codon:yes gene_type:complete